ncbi:MAG: ATP-binding protein [Massilia sp.]
MKISIGLRLFVCVLLAILGVVGGAMMLMRQNVMHSFSDYALQIELDRLDELSRSLTRQYRAHGNWDFLPKESGSRNAFIAAELERLDAQRGVPAPPVPPIAPIAPVAPAAPRSPAAPIGSEIPEPPPPAAPPLPPLPPPPPGAPTAATGVETSPDQLALPERVTLLDEGERYLAGRNSGAEAGARRALRVGAQTIGYLQVARVASPSDAMAAVFLEQIRKSLVTIIVGSVLLSALAAVLLAAHFRRPILGLAGGARALAEGRFDTRLPETRSDELGELARSFNQLAQQLDRMEASRRQWVADTSHELRTPLSVLRAQLEALQDGVRPASAEGTAAMLRQVLDLNTLIDQLYALARADVGELDLQRAPLDLAQLASEQATAFVDKFSAAGMTVTTLPSTASCMVRADPERLRQVLANLLENCIRYSGHGTQVQLLVQHSGAMLVLRVDDSGAGVPEAALPQLGQRFYRVEASRSRAHGGAGLGLALCQRIVAAHGGRIAFSRSPLGGLQASITLPQDLA